jgi:hypothetical protein
LTSALGDGSKKTKKPRAIKRRLLNRQGRDCHANPPLGGSSELPLLGFGAALCLQFVPWGARTVNKKFLGNFKKCADSE